MIECSIVTPLAKQSEAGLSGLIVRTATGERAILLNHADITARLEDDSRVRLLRGGEEELVYRLGRSSFLRFAANRAVILSSDCVRQGSERNSLQSHRP